MLPEYIREQVAYKDGNMSEALEAAFLGFDQKMLEPEILHELKVIAGVDEEEEDNGEWYSTIV